MALYSNTTGGFNTANGAETLFSNTTGVNNTANGSSALYSNTTGGSVSYTHMTLPMNLRGENKVVDLSGHKKDKAY